MSRIIVKNLPKSITPKKLEKIFASHGTITDLQLKYTKDGVFRQFAFVGFKTEEEAEAAKKYFNNTFVYTSKISVDICTNLSDPNKPKSWKKHISEQKASKLKAEEKEKEKEKKSKKKKKESDIPEELLNDAQFKGFLELHEDRRSKPVWAEDVGNDVTKCEDDGSSSDSDYEDNFKILDKSEKDVSHLPAEKKSDAFETEEPVQKNSKESKTPVQKEKTFDDSFTVKLRNLPYHCKKNQIKQFFQPLKIASLRLPPRAKGFAYVKFKSERDLKQALIKNKGFLAGHRIDVVQYVRKVDVTKLKNGEQVGSREENEELLAETGRIYIRNLCFSATEKDIENLFKKYGPLAEVHLPIDYLTKKSQGFAFVSFVFAEHAVKAFTELDGSIFQGRVLHLIPAKAKKEYVPDENETNFKKKKEAKMKQLRGSSHNWNILFLGMNAVADIIAEKYNVEKSYLLSTNSKENVAVRMALAETQMVSESRQFLIDNGVQLDAFSQAATERSKTVVVVKHLPAKTTPGELRELFGKFGSLKRVILPPSGLVALIEFEQPTEARHAFKKLAYTRFHTLPLYLEWAPVDGVVDPPTQPPSKPDEEEEKHQEETKGEEPNSTTENVSVDQPPPGTTVFVKGINFDTTQEDFRKHFEQWGPVYSAHISIKPDLKTGRILSMGFGFVQYRDTESASRVVQNLQRSTLDGHVLELKFANRETKPQTSSKRRKYEVTEQTSAKFVVRNVPFQASESELKHLFQEFGTLRSLRLPKKSDGSGEHRGFGFVEYLSEENAERAFNALCHSTHFFGRRLVLEWAKVNSEDVDELRKRTAKGFADGQSRKTLKKQRLNDDVAIAAIRHGKDDD